MGADASMGQFQGHSRSEGDHGGAHRHYVLVARRWWWLLLLVVIIATVVAYAVSAAQADVYRAEATLLYGGTYVDSTQLGLELSGVNTSLSMPGVRALVGLSTDTQATETVDYTVSASPVAMTEGITAQTLVPTRIVAVRAEAGDASLAAEVANAYASAFVEYRTKRTRAAARQAAKEVRAELSTFNLPEAESASGYDFQASAYLDLIQELRRLETAARTGSGGYTVLSKAETPTSPSSPQPIRAGVLGLGVGIFAAAILMLLLYRYDPGVDSDRDVALLVRLPVLGRLPKLRSQDTVAGLPDTPTTLGGNVTEAYRRVRASLTTVLAEDAVKTVLFTSGCHDEGASAALGNMAVAWARAGRRVIVIDADLDNPSMHSLFGLPNDVGVTSVIGGRARLSEALQSVDLALPGEAGGDRPKTASADAPASLAVLTSGPRVPDGGELVAGFSMAGLLADVKKKADIVLVDSPGLLEAAAASSLANVVDGLVFICDMRVSTRRSLRQCREYLDLVPCRQMGIIITERPPNHLTRSRPHADQAAGAVSEDNESAAAVSVTSGGPS